MFDSTQWDALVAGESCPLCTKLAAEASEGSGASETPLVTLGSGKVYLQNDGDFPGYCILVYKRHQTELYQLDEVERSQFIEDIAAIASAIEAACKPAKLNYAILGNEVPHLHAHIIPRYPTDGYWGRPIWARAADQKRTLADEEYARLAETLGQAIKAEAPVDDEVEDAEDAAYFDARN